MTKSMRAADCIACVGLLAAIAASLRALRGPFHLGSVWVRSPIAIESVFALVFLALTVTHLRGTRRAGPKKAGAPLAFPWVPLALTLVAVAIPFSGNLNDPFLSDDYILVKHADLESGRIGHIATSAGGDGSYRPLGYIYYGLLKSFGGSDPWKWHAGALAIHLINCGLLFATVWALWPDALLAAAAAALFGLNGARPEVVVWSAGNFDLLACAFTLAALLCAAHRFPLLVAPFVVLAIASKESTYAAPLVIFAFLAAAGRLRESKTRLSIGLGFVAAAVMFIYRWTLFHGPGGYLDAATGRPQVLSFHILPALKALFLRLWVVLLFPVNWDAKPASVIAAFAILIGCCALLYSLTMAEHGRTSLLWLLAGVLGAMLPAYHLGLIGDSLTGSRVLYLPGLAFAVLCAHLTVWRKGACLAFILCTGGILFHNLQAWHATAKAAEIICAGPALASRPPSSLNGVVYFANGYAECREMKGR